MSENGIKKGLVIHIHSGRKGQQMMDGVHSIHKLADD
jgi:glyceraldehyde-3-phosphate dehydrogenase/erythrose-4-phosphate dehydrogenase